MMFRIYSTASPGACRVSSTDGDRGLAHAGEQVLVMGVHLNSLLVNNPGLILSLHKEGR